MDENVVILAHGTKVKTVNGNIDAFITGVCIRGKNISYEISYYSGGDFKQAWFYRFEIEVDIDKKKAGFEYESRDNLKLLSQKSDETSE